MSSFVGHTLTGGLAYSLRKDPSKYRYLWLCWLLFIAIAPDLDHFISQLQKTQNDGVRITHSLGFAMILPIATIVGLFLIRCRGTDLRLRSLQVVFAGVSHILLDFLVGVHPMPLFWPLHSSAYRLTYGLLPSAGALDLTNYFLYRNLVVELGILLPIYSVIFLFMRQRKILLNKIWLAPVLGLVAFILVQVSMSFSR